ncbi:MAG: acyl-CoA thioesterase [Treponema sp.]|nr:acyl-CoA thioesterase [Treponema sp.]MCR4632364.1 acyl-CoA thioesterase [Treponema sp.]
MKAYIHKVNYYETDKMGITHHSNYVRWMEEARIDFLDQLGWSFIKLEEEGIASPVMSIECNYKKPTTFPDLVSIMVTIEKLSAVKLTFNYEFKVNDELVFTGKSSHCFLDEKGAPVILEKRYPKFYEDLKNIQASYGA